MKYDLETHQDIISLLKWKYRKNNFVRQVLKFQNALFIMGGVESSFFI